MSPRHRASAIIKKSGKLLLIHRITESGEYWTFPGGGIEEGEDPEVAVDREVLEEVGLKVISKRFAFKITEPHKSGMRDNYYFLCEVEEGDPVVGGPEGGRSSQTNIYDPKWVDINFAKSVTWATTQEAIKDKIISFL